MGGVPPVHSLLVTGRGVRCAAGMSFDMDVVPHQVVGPFGEAVTLVGLPPQETTRWTIRRKAEIVAAVDGGLLTFDDACERYNLSAEELTSWREAVRRNGLSGLRVTRAQEHRHSRGADDDALRKSEAGVRRFLAALKPCR